MTTYLYRNRPPGIGCQPDDYSSREDWLPAKEIDGRFFMGKVEYSEALPFDQVRRYELWPESKVERAEYVFWSEGDDAEWLRTDYLAQPVEMLRQYAPRDVKAHAALIILGLSE